MLDQVWSVWAAAGMAAVALITLFIDDTLHRRQHGRPLRQLPPGT